jgi:hypothetical protein
MAVRRTCPNWGKAGWTTGRMATIRPDIGMDTGEQTNDA